MDYVGVKSSAAGMDACAVGVTTIDVFDLDRALVQDYERFARSFTQIRATDIRAQVEAIYASRRFWPDPLVSINPNFERDIAIDTLVADGSLDPSTGQVFRIAGQPITLYRHQSQAVLRKIIRMAANELAW